MRRIGIRIAAALAFVVLGILLGLALPAACGQRAETPDDDAATPRPPASENLVPLDATRPDYTDRHPNGSTLQVTSIEIRERSLVVGVSLVNGYRDRVSLATNGFFRDNDIWLVDNLGNAYRFDGKADVSVAPGEELRGSLVFLGVPPVDARTVTIKTNVNDPAAAVDFNERDRDNDAPVFSIEGIPLPGDVP